MEKSNLMSDFLEPGRLRKLLHRIYAGSEDEPDLHKVLLKMTGGKHATGVMFALVIKWDSRMRGRGDGWWYKSDLSWENEAALSQHDVRQGRELMKAVGVCSKRQMALDGRITWHYRLDPRQFWQAFAQACEMRIEQLIHLIMQMEAESQQSDLQKSPVTLGKIPTDPVENPQGPVEFLPETVGKIPRVIHPESSAFSTGNESGYAAGADAHGRAREEPAAANGTLPDPEKRLKKTGEPRLPVVPGPQRTPPPVPRGPLPTSARTIVENDALWKAFARVCGFEQMAVPDNLADAYLEARDMLNLMQATTIEIEKVAQERIDLKKRQQANGMSPAPYRFNYLPIDLFEWRQSRKSTVSFEDRVKASPYAKFYANSHLLEPEENTPMAAGCSAPADAVPVRDEV